MNFFDSFLLYLTFYYYHLFSVTHCPSRSTLNLNWTHMAVHCSVQPWQTLPRIPSSLLQAMNVCTCTSQMSEGPALRLTDKSFWLIGIEAICSYSSETQSHLTSENNNNMSLMSKWLCYIQLRIFSPQIRIWKQRKLPLRQTAADCL